MLSNREAKLSNINGLKFQRVFNSILLADIKSMGKPIFFRLYTKLFTTNKAVFTNHRTIIEDLTRGVISYEFMKRAFGEFYKFHMK